MEITWKVITGDGEGGSRGKGTGNKKYKWQVEYTQEEVKKRVGNGEAEHLYV